jgi:hypothetical protein
MSKVNPAGTAPLETAPVAMAPKVRNFNRATGALDAEKTPGEFAGLKRSWDRFTRAPGEFNSSFSFEGARIFFDALEDEDFEKIKGMEQESKSRGEALRVKQNRLEELENELYKLPLDTDEENPERIELETQVAQLSKEIEDESSEIEKLAGNFFGDIVAMSVKGWSGAPVAFSPEAVTRLPLEMSVIWAKTILEKSRLGAVEADFLPPS